MNHSKVLTFITLCGLAALRPLRADTASTQTTVAASTTASVSVSTSADLSSVRSLKSIHAIHVTAWMAGSKKYRAHLEDVFKTTVINSVVIDIKEYEGEVYIPGVKMAEAAGSYVPAMPDIADWLAQLKREGIYTVARIVVFKDNIMPRRKKSLAVKNPQGDLWFDRNKVTWLDPYNPETWRYNLVIAVQASKLGFDEIQFDYLRFPTDGHLSQMRFSKPYQKTAASLALVEFLRQARQVLKPLGVPISIDVFGLTTTVTTGMGIGQLFGPMAEQVDYICPMTYPSHYAKGEYGIANPNDEPYRTIHLAMNGALGLLGPAGAGKLRPYLQDFSLKGRGIHYGKKEVRAQMQAAADLGVNSWTLWNARCSYTLGAIESPIIGVTKSTTAITSSTESKTVSK